MPSSTALIPAEDLTRQYQGLNPRSSLLCEVLPTGRYTLGPTLEAFEKEMANFSGVGHCAGISSGTAALHLALAAMDVGPGDEVIVPANTYVATAFAVSYLGARPVFADVEPEHSNLGVGGIAARITNRTKVIIPVHMYGHPVDMDPVLTLARHHGLKVLEDASHAHGALYKGKMAASLGDAAAVSFYPSKVLGAYGDAGGVLTNDADLDHKVRILRYMGQEVSTTHHDWVPGAWTDSSGSPTGQAASPAELDQQRREIAGWYSEALQGLPIRIPAEAAYARHVFYMYTIHTPARDALSDFLAGRGIATQRIYPRPVPMQPCYEQLGYSESDLPIATRLSTELLCLPMFPELRQEEVERVAAEIRTFFLGQRP
jgi:dTDP-4-amino-4,6-dideoxygalactose transaminase